jgi:hypothetical protein
MKFSTIKCRNMSSKVVSVFVVSPRGHGAPFTGRDLDPSGRSRPVQACARPYCVPNRRGPHYTAYTISKSCHRHDAMDCGYHFLGALSSRRVVPHRLMRSRKKGEYLDLFVKKISCTNHRHKPENFRMPNKRKTKEWRTLKFWGFVIYYYYFVIILINCTSSV